MALQQTVQAQESEQARNKRLTKESAANNQYLANNDAILLKKSLDRFKAILNNQASFLSSDEHQASLQAIQTQANGIILQLEFILEKIEGKKTSETLPESVGVALGGLLCIIGSSAGGFFQMLTQHFGQYSTANASDIADAIFNINNVLSRVSKKMDLSDQKDQLKKKYQTKTPLSDMLEEQRRELRDIARQVNAHTKHMTNNEETLKEQETLILQIEEKRQEEEKALEKLQQEIAQFDTQSRLLLSYLVLSTNSLLTTVAKIITTVLGAVVGTIVGTITLLPALYTTSNIFDKADVFFAILQDKSVQQKSLSIRIMRFIGLCILCPIIGAIMGCIAGAIKGYSVANTFKNKARDRAGIIEPQETPMLEKTSEPTTKRPDHMKQAMKFAKTAIELAQNKETVSTLHTLQTTPVTSETILENKSAKTCNPLAKAKLQAEQLFKAATQGAENVEAFVTNEQPQEGSQKTPEKPQPQENNHKVLAKKLALEAAEFVTQKQSNNTAKPELNTKQEEEEQTFFNKLMQFIATLLQYISAKPVQNQAPTKMAGKPFTLFSRPKMTLPTPTCTIPEKQHTTACTA